MLLGLVSGLCLHIIFNIMTTFLPIQINNKGLTSKKAKQSIDQAYPRLKAKNFRDRSDKVNSNFQTRELQRIRATKTTSPQENLFRQVIPEEGSYDFAS